MFDKKHCSPNSWKGGNGVDQDALSPDKCAAYIKSNPATCNQNFFNWAGNGDGNCGCITDLKDDCSQSYPHEQVKVMTFRYGVVHAEGKRCKTEKWLNIKNKNDPNECLALIKSKKDECNQNFFNWGSAVLGGDGNCGCITDLITDCGASSLDSSSTVVVMASPSDEKDGYPPEDVDCTAEGKAPYNTYHGCYENSGANRRPPSDGDGVTPDQCKQIALDQGQLFFGLEHPQGGKSDCLALDQLPAMVKRPDSECEGGGLFEGTYRRHGNAYRLAVYGASGARRCCPGLSPVEESAINCAGYCPESDSNPRATATTAQAATPKCLSVVPSFHPQRKSCQVTARTTMMDVISVCQVARSTTSFSPFMMVVSSILTIPGK